MGNYTLAPLWRSEDSSGSTRENQPTRVVKHSDAMKIRGERRGMISPSSKKGTSLLYRRSVYRSWSQLSEAGLFNLKTSLLARLRHYCLVGVELSCSSDSHHLPNKWQPS